MHDKQQMLTGYYCLPDWVAGRYNDDEQIAIVFNNLTGETSLFEGPTAILWRELLFNDYLEPFDVGILSERLCCKESDLLTFFSDLIDKYYIIDHILSRSELSNVAKTVNEKKSSFLQSSKGVGNFNSVYESADSDYRNKIERYGIPFSTTIELTYNCNEACIHCYNPNSPREGGFDVQKPTCNDELEPEDYFSILDSLAKIGVAKIVFTGGDPFMKRGIMSILTYAHNLKFAFSVYTNGLALFSNPYMYEELRRLYPQYIGLSLYSTIPEVHDGITRRKGSCLKTMAVAEMCYKDAIGLQIKCPIMKANKDSYGTVFDFAIQMNGMPQYDINITSGIDGDCFASQRLRLDKEQLKEMLKDRRIPLTIENKANVVARKPEMEFCGAGKTSFSIRPDGTVNPCCAFPLNCGNIKDSSLESIWRDSIYLKSLRALRYKNSDKCGTEKYCMFCNRCIGQSFIEHGVAENHSNDNCFLAIARYELATGDTTVINPEGGR